MRDLYIEAHLLVLPNSILYQAVCLRIAEQQQFITPRLPATIGALVAVLILLTSYISPPFSIGL
ncbi:hypothetical protein ASF12_23020 [Paenibacillus sp. Leaf72]|nr:hypothetical protein ASF12_23020 [Paenibacillus sp. Leaf72]